MKRNKQEVFDELYTSFEEGVVISIELQEEAHEHGIPIEAVEDAALSSLDEEDDLDD